MSAHGITPRPRVGIDVAPHADPADPYRVATEFIEQSYERQVSLYREMVDALEERIRIQDEIIATLKELALPLPPRR